MLRKSTKTGQSFIHQLITYFNPKSVHQLIAISRLTKTRIYYETILYNVSLVKENKEFWVKVFLRLNNVLESFDAYLWYVRYILLTGFLGNFDNVEAEDIHFTDLKNVVHNEGLKQPCILSFK